MNWSWVKNCTYQIGEILPRQAIYSVECLHNYVSAAAWWKRQEQQPRMLVSCRNDIFSCAGAMIGNRQALYLEFGVYYGESLRLCSRLLSHPAARLHGFDSFQGLPEAWSARYGAGDLSVNGKIPVFDDPRIRLYPGWFEEVLPAYTPPTHEILLINCDADLFSSALTVLHYARQWLRPGDLLYFDEFHHAAGERLAFEMFRHGNPLQFIPISATHARNHVLWQAQARN